MPRPRTPGAGITEGEAAVSLGGDQRLLLRTGFLAQHHSVGACSKARSDLRAEVGRLKAAIRLVDVVSQSLPLKREGRLWRARCPFHNERSASFTVYDEHYHCFGCGAHGDVITWVMHRQGLTFREAIRWLDGSFDARQTHRSSASERSSRDHGDAAVHVELARRIWMESIPLPGTPAEVYLTSRGLQEPTGIAAPEQSVLRFHPHCPFGSDRLPAMVALMTDPLSLAPRGIHRTFLQPDGRGKAPIPQPKMMLGPAGVIRLYNWMGDGLGLGEGIESCLAVAQRLQWEPIWAAGSAGGIAKFPVVPNVALTLFPDRDRNGTSQEAARTCADRWADAGAEVWIAAPTVKDWDDATKDTVPWR